MGTLDSVGCAAQPCLQGNRLFWQNGDRTTPPFELASEGRRTARAKSEPGRTTPADEDVSVLTGLGINNGCRGSVSPLLEILHAGIDGLAFQSLKKPFRAHAASAAAKFDHVPSRFRGIGRILRREVS
jgi:hypothetical protein